MAKSMDNTSLDNVPEEYDGMLDCASLAICCAFNRRGSLLAVGCNDGRVVIWDLLTRGIARNIQAHAQHPVCSICWSRNCQKLVSASLDNTICVWKALTGECLIRFTFPSPILKAQFNPRNDKLILVCPLKHPSILINIDYEDSNTVYCCLPLDPSDNDPNVTSSFDKRGQYIYSGNSRGRITVHECPTKSDKVESNQKFNIVSSFLLHSTASTPPGIREIEFPPKNKTFFLVNSTDRSIRLFECERAIKAGINGKCEEVRKFQDLVNKTMWRRCCFSGDPQATLVCAGSARQHALYIWETRNGTIKKMLQGTKGEILLDVQWHPHRPIVTSISSGLVSVWTRPQIENWSAFAPDFKELEENMEYEERESEFDAEDEDNPKNLNNNTGNVDSDSEMVDVTDVNVEKDLMSSDEENVDADALDYIPVDLNDIITSKDDSGQELTLVQTEELDQSKSKSIKIILENPPLDEVHPLSLGTSKRIRVNDKITNPLRKNIKLDRGP